MNTLEPEETNITCAIKPLSSCSSPPQPPPPPPRFGLTICRAASFRWGLHLVWDGGAVGLRSVLLLIVIMFYPTCYTHSPCHESHGHTVISHARPTCGPGPGQCQRAGSHLPLTCILTMKPVVRLYENRLDSIIIIIISLFAQH